MAAERKKTILLSTTTLGVIAGAVHVAMNAGDGQSNEVQGHPQ
jgi:hypothetical protein